MVSLKRGMRELRERQEAALIAFFMAALPDEELALECVLALERGGCDVLELGIPFSDPVADGEIIERFHHRGVRQGLNLESGLKFARRVKEKVNMPLVLFSYLNPILRLGQQGFLNLYQEAGIEALIVPDMPLQEASRLEGWGLDIVPMAAPSSSDSHLAALDGSDPSFIYCVSVRGITGVRDLPLDQVEQYLKRVRNLTLAPLALGFGLSSPEQIGSLKPYTDAFVVGSHLAKMVEDMEDRPEQLLASLEREIRAMKNAAVKTRY